MDRLASGATWQSGGQGLHIQNTLIQTHFTKYSRALYEKLHNQGHDIGKSLIEKINYNAIFQCFVFIRFY